MPYIGNITQDFNVNNAMLDTDSVTSIKIVDGTIEGADIAANLDLSDSQKIRFGAGNDLQIYHDGTHSYLDNSTGSLFIRGDAIKLRNAAGNEAYIECFANGAVKLSYDDSIKFETTSTGVKIDGGNVTNSLEINGTGSHELYSYHDSAGVGWATGASSSYGELLYLDESNSQIQLYTAGSLRVNVNSTGVQIPNDSGKMMFGTGNDLQIYHDGSHSRIDEVGTGNLMIQSNNAVFIKKGTSENIATFNVDGAVELYYDNSVKLSTINGGISVSGGVNTTGASSFNGDIFFADNKKTIFGAGSDLQIFHDGTHNLILGSPTVLIKNQANSESYIRCTENAQVELYYDNSKKFETRSGGVTVQGQLSVANTASGGVSLSVPDNAKAAFGTSDDLQIYHDGANSLIDDAGTGILGIRSENGINFYKKSSNEFLLKAIPDGAVELYHDNSKKFETHSAGVLVSGNVYLNDNNKFIAGTSNDLQIYHDGSNTRIIEGGTGHLYVDTSSFIIRNAAGSETLANFVQDGGVELYHNNVKRITTRSGGGAQDGAVIYGNSSNVAINLFTDTSERGTVYANSSNQVGFLDSGGDWAIKHTNDSQTEFYVQTNRKAAIDADGLKFNNDTAAANALDDYEEGTFTPSFGYSLANFAGTYSAQGGSYTKIGNTVNVRFQIAATKGSGTGGTATLYNLPFNAVNVDNYRASGVMGYYEGFTSDKPILILVEANDNKFPFRHSGDTNATSISAGNMSSSFRFYISITYQTA